MRRVPNILGDQVAVARDKVEDAGFEFAQRPAPTCSPNRTVTEQDPPAAAEAKEGSTVTATVSLGLVIAVPDVVGEPEQAASERLEEEQLRPESEPRSSRKVQAGRVISTEPEAGSEVDCESTVTMLVSKGANTITLPNLIGPSRRWPSRSSPGGTDRRRRRARRRRARRNRDRPGPGARVRAPARRPGDDRRLKRGRLRDRPRRRRPVGGRGALEPRQPGALGRRGRAGDRGPVRGRPGARAGPDAPARGCAAATR